jgi:hypothetical protein
VYAFIVGGGGRVLEGKREAKLTSAIKAKELLEIRDRNKV